jgi:hypothetical protein
MKTFVEEIKVIDSTTRKDVTTTLRCLNALRITLASTMFLWKSIKNEVKFLCTRRLNQDPLENSFGAIHQQGGNSENPTPLQFTRAYQKLFFNSYLLPTSTGNCAADLDALLVSCKAATSTANPWQETSWPAPFTVTESNECADFKSESVKGNMFAKNAITYVSGSVVRKCLKKHKCPMCAEALTSNDLDSPDKLLCEFKAYDNSKPFGGLTVPDERLVRYIHSAEQIFVDTFPNVISKQGIGKHLMSMLPKFKLQECPQFPSQIFQRGKNQQIFQRGKNLAQAKIKQRL